MAEQHEKRNTAPYISFSTFTSALDNVAANDVPNFIDRHSFPSFSGAAVAGTLSSFRFFGLIDVNGKPEPSLHALAMNKDERQGNIKALLEKNYGNLIALDLSRTTPSEFDREFSGEQYGVSGDTRVKAKTFFIKAAQFAEIPISKLLLNKSRTSGPRKPRKSKSEISGHADAITTQSKNIEDRVTKGTALKEIELIDSGKQVWIGTDANLFDIKAGNDLNFVLSLIKLFDKYEKGESIDFNPNSY